MNLLVLLILHAGWSLETCRQLRTSCEQNAFCATDIQTLRLCIDFNIDKGDKCTSLRNHSATASACARDDGEISLSKTVLTNATKETSHDSVVNPVQSFPLHASRMQWHYKRNPGQSTRYARSPTAGQITKWKNELFEELQNTKSLTFIPCNKALYEICLKHLSCRHLWNIFRNACAVDPSNKCLMSNREDCWQAFEGLSWTGLGNCSCHDQNSDCHWIRLQTRYNKCVYEISLSGNMPSFISFLPREHLLFEKQTIQRQFQNSSAFYTSQSSDSAHPPTATRSEQISTSAVTKEDLRDSEEVAAEQPLAAAHPKNDLHLHTITMESLPATTISKPLLPLSRPKTNDAQTQTETISTDTFVEGPLNETNASKHYRLVPKASENSKHAKIRPTTTTSETGGKDVFLKSKVFNARSMSMPVSVNKTTSEILSVGASQLIVPTEYEPSVTIKTVSEFMQKNFSTSTCVAAGNRCERFQNCKWHMSEVQIRCGGHCSRHLCAAAVQRFARYVARPSVESLMFCHCDKMDTECLNYQQILYPRCLYSDTGEVSLSCKEAVEKCQLDQQCRHYSSAFFHYCPVQKEQCAISELDHCRQAIIAVRGTYLDYPCYCPQDDAECRRYQAGMLPNNPCIEKSMIEYSRLVTDILPDQSNSQSTAGAVAGSSKYDRSSGKPTRGDNTSRNALSAKENPWKQQTDWLNKSKTVNADRLPIRSQQGGTSVNEKDESLAKQPVAHAETFRTTNRMDVQKADAKLQMAEESKPDSLAGKVYEPDGGGHNELLNGPKSLNESESGAMNVSEREVPQFQSKFSEKNSLQKSGSPPNKIKENEDMEYFNAYEATAESFKPELLMSKPTVKSRLTKNKGRKLPTQNMNHRVPGAAQKQKSGKLSAPRIIGSMYANDSNKDPTKFNLPVDVGRMSVEESITKKQQNKDIKTTVVSRKPKAPGEFIGQATATPLKNYATEPPVTPGGCAMKDVFGNEVIYHKGSVFRRYHDWAGRCSSWCTCSDEEEMSCMELPCLVKGDCRAPLTKIEYGERLYMAGRGACTCLSGLFICERPSNFPDLSLGLYLLVGYSIEEVTMLKGSVPKNILERAGFVSGNDYIMHDIGSRLQLALERLMPSSGQCRITLLKDYKEEGNVIYQLEWFGVNRFKNESGKRWHTGKAEKVCSPYVTQLANIIMRNEAVRYDLVLSTVKQIRAYDLLDGLPDRSSLCRLSAALIFTTLTLLLFFIT